MQIVFFMVVSLFLSLLSDCIIARVDDFVKGFLKVFFVNFFTKWLQQTDNTAVCVIKARISGDQCGLGSTDFLQKNFGRLIFIGNSVRLDSQRPDEQGLIGVEIIGNAPVRLELGGLP